MKTYTATTGDLVYAFKAEDEEGAKDYIRAKLDKGDHLSWDIQERGLSRMVRVGDSITDLNDDCWTITRIDDNIAYYNQPTREFFEDETSNMIDSCFIARFIQKGSYNANMTLTDDIERGL